MSYLRNHKLLLLIIGVLLVANIVLLYFFVLNKPQSEHRVVTFGPEEMGKRTLTKLREEVGFNEQQITVFDSLRNHQLKNMKPFFKDITKSKEEFFSLIYNEGVSDSTINAYASRIGEKQMALDLSTFHYFQSIKALCTEEQKPKMDSFIKQIVKRIVNNNGPRKPADKKKENKS